MNTLAIREAIDTARDAAQKASVMMYDFFYHDAGGDVDAPMQAMHDMFKQPKPIRGEEERCLVDWVCQRREILTRLGIVEDYVNKIVDTLGQLHDEPIKAAGNDPVLPLGEIDKADLEDHRMMEEIVVPFEKSLSPEQHKMYMNVEAYLVHKVCHEMDEESRLSA